MEYTNGDKTGLNKYVTKVSQEITNGSLEWGSERSDVEWVVTVLLSYTAKSHEVKSSRMLSNIENELAEELEG